MMMKVGIRMAYSHYTLAIMQCLCPWKLNGNVRKFNGSVRIAMSKRMVAMNCGVTRTCCSSMAEGHEIMKDRVQPRRGKGRTKIVRLSSSLDQLLESQDTTDALSGIG